MTFYQNFCATSAREVQAQAQDQTLSVMTRQWFDLVAKYKYCYHFEALGRPIIQFPQDIVALQEIIWKVKPDIIIETGIAHGGSLIWSASLLALLDYCEASATNNTLNVKASKRKVIGIDIDIREHNRKAIEEHPLAHLIEMIEGSSTSKDVITQVKEKIHPQDRVLVCLDSNHTHAHVLCELEVYAPLVSIGSYCIVFDTVIEHMPENAFPDRPWGVGNNPMTAVKQFLSTHSDFEVDKTIEDKLLITVAPHGFLRRTS